MPSQPTFTLDRSPMFRSQDGHATELRAVHVCVWSDWPHNAGWRGAQCDKATHERSCTALARAARLRRSQRRQARPITTDSVAGASANASIRPCDRLSGARRARGSRVVSSPRYSRVSADQACVPQDCDVGAVDRPDASEYLERTSHGLGTHVWSMVRDGAEPLCCWFVFRDGRGRANLA